MTGSWPTAVVLDLDGTLIDSSPDVAAAANVALAEAGIRAGADEVRGWLGDGARELIRKALRDHDVPADDARIDALTAAFEKAYTAEPVVETRAYPGAAEALAALGAAGVGVAVCTNKPEAIARLVLDRTGLGRHVRTLAGGGAHRLKPDPDGVKACLAALGADADQAVYIGDHAVDVATARAAGLPVVVVAFGYSQTPVETLGADAVLPAWRELPAALAQLAPAPPTEPAAIQPK